MSALPIVELDFLGITKFVPFFQPPNGHVDEPTPQMMKKRLLFHSKCQQALSIPRGLIIH